MEFHVNQIRDTRERISIKHLKSLDIVQREIHKIMPNDLSETYKAKVTDEKIGQEDEVDRSDREEQQDGEAPSKDQLSSME